MEEATLFTRQSPKDPLPMCQVAEDTLEGHLSMYCQVRAVLVVEKEKEKNTIRSVRHHRFLSLT